MSFSLELQKSADIFWEKEKSHEFILGIGSGNLDKSRFVYYLKQDYLFLIGYSRAISIGISKAPQISDMAFLSNLLNETLNTEMQLHVEYCSGFNIEKKDLENTSPSATTVSYIEHMINSSNIGFLHSLVAILPCAWSYGEIATYLNENIVTDHTNNPYIDWVNMYISDEFKSLSISIMQTIDKYAEKLNNSEKLELTETFLKSSDLEYQFWNAALYME